MYLKFSAKCLLIEHKNKKSKRRHTSLLNRALWHIQKVVADDPCYYHLVTQGKIFIEMGLHNYKERREKFAEADKIFQNLIEKCKEMKNHGHRLCEVLHQYSLFWKLQYCETKKEISSLEHCVEWDNSLPDKVACNHATKCQEQLLKYATNQLKDGKKRQLNQHLTNAEAYQIQSKIFSIQQNYHSAVFFIEKAIQSHDTDKLTFQQEFLARNLLKILETEFMDSHVIKVQATLDRMKDERIKTLLEYELRILQINKEKHFHHEKLKDLKASSIQFEEAVKDLECSKEIICDAALNVLAKARSSLDYALTDLRDKKYTEAKVI